MRKDKWYEEFYVQNDFVHPKRDIVYISHILQHLNRLEYTDCRILDVGCGTGFQCGHFSECGIGTVVGVDFSSTGLIRAHGHVPEAAFSLADAEQLPFKNDSFDVVFCQGLSLYSVDDLSATYHLGRELLRCCKIGGLFIFAVSTNLSGGRRRSGWKEHKKRDVLEYLTSLDCQVAKSYFIERRILLSLLGKRVFNNIMSELILPLTCMITRKPGTLVCVAMKTK